MYVYCNYSQSTLIKLYNENIGGHLTPLHRVDQIKRGQCSFFRRSKARFKEFSKFLASETTVYALLEAYNLNTFRQRAPQKLMIFCVVAF